MKGLRGGCARAARGRVRASPGLMTTIQKCSVVADVRGCCVVRRMRGKRQKQKNFSNDEDDSFAYLGHNSKIQLMALHKLRIRPGKNL